MIHQFFFISGIVFWVSIVTCCLVLIFLRRSNDLPSDSIIYENEIKAVRSKEISPGDVLYLTEEPELISKEDLKSRKKFTLTLEKYLDGEAKATQYEND